MICVIEVRAYHRRPAQTVYALPGCRLQETCDVVGAHQARGRIEAAPLRDVAAVRAAERRREVWSAPELDPCDPWPEQRIGYDDPTSSRMSEPRLPPKRALEALRDYLERTYPRLSILF